MEATRHVFCLLHFGKTQEGSNSSSRLCSDRRGADGDYADHRGPRSQDLTGQLALRSSPQAVKQVLPHRKKQLAPMVRLYFAASKTSRSPSCDRFFQSLLRSVFGVKCMKKESDRNWRSRYLEVRNWRSRYLSSPAREKAWKAEKPRNTPKPGSGLASLGRNFLGVSAAFVWKRTGI